jgi:hypothetical protein
MKHAGIGSYGRIGGTLLVIRDGFATTNVVSSFVNAAWLVLLLLTRKDSSMIV